MQEILPPQGSAPALPELLPADGPVHHMVQAHPNNLVDPWWMNEALVRGHREFLYRQWRVDIQAVGPEVVDDRFPDGVSLVRRGTQLDSERVQCVIECEGAMACIQVWRQLVWVGVSARDLSRGRLLLEGVVAAFPEVKPHQDDEHPQIGLGIWVSSTDSRSHRTFDVQKWDDIAGNYAFQTREALLALMDPSYSPEGRGQLLVWHGPPGTGKSYALGALAYAWREWATMHYVADPESMLSDTGYLMDFMLDPPHGDERWRIAVLEDAGELLGFDARSQTGPGLGRLLNLTDGMLGKGLKTLFLITTNEPVGQFHEAVVRPGRCAACIGFEPLPIEQAKAWLLERGATDVARRLKRPSSVAELFAMLAGDLEPQAPQAVGFYL